MIISSLADYALNSEQRAKHVRIGRGPCHHWKMRAEGAVWAEYSLLLPFRLVGTVVHISKGVPYRAHDHPLWNHGLPFCRSAFLPTAAWPRGLWWVLWACSPGVSQLLWLDSWGRIWALHAKPLSLHPTSDLGGFPWFRKIWSCLDDFGSR